MIYEHFFQGYFLGFSVATTIGVSGVLCLQNMMTGNLVLGLSSAIAAGLADMTCGIIVASGMSFFEQFLYTYRWHLSLVVGCLLCVIGIMRIFSHVDMMPRHRSSSHPLAAILGVYFLSVIDPVSIADFAALCVGLTLDFSMMQHLYGFIAGLFFGSITWWLFLWTLIMVFHQSVSVRFFDSMQRIVGLFIFGLGLWTLCKVKVGF